MPDLVAPTRLLWTVEDAAFLLSIGRTKMYELIGDKTIVSVGVGRSRRIPHAALEGYVSNLMANTL